MKTTKYHFSALRLRNTKRPCLFLSFLQSKLWRRTWGQVVYLGGNHRKELIKWGKWDKEEKVVKNSYFCYKKHPYMQWTRKSIKISWNIKGVYPRLPTPKEGGRGIVQWRVPQHFWVAHTRSNPENSHYHQAIEESSAENKTALVVRRGQLEVIWSLRVISTISGTAKIQDKAWRFEIGYQTSFLQAINNYIPVSKGVQWSTFIHCWRKYISTQFDNIN